MICTFSSVFLSISMHFLHSTLTDVGSLPGPVDYPTLINRCLSRFYLGLWNRNILVTRMNIFPMKRRASRSLAFLSAMVLFWIFTLICFYLLVRSFLIFISWIIPFFVFVAFFHRLSRIYWLVDWNFGWGLLGERKTSCRNLTSFYFFCYITSVTTL